jgi:hypothetical protein
VSGLLLLAALPTLYWPWPVETAPALEQAGIERMAMPEENVAAWQGAGFNVVAVGEDERASRVQVETPGTVRGRVNLASASLRPWLDANGWRFLRAPHGRYWCDATAGKAPLAAAEAFAYGADEVLEIDRSDLEDLGRMLGFLAGVPERALPPVCDIALVDDGSDLVGEVLNLMVRRNLLVVPVHAPRPEAPLNVRIGTPEFPEQEAEDPDAFALSLRRRLTDERRSLRLFGSEVVLGRLTADGSRARLQLLNYGRRPIDGLRVRLRGEWSVEAARVFGVGRVEVEDSVVAGGATEFSLPTLGPYAVIDLAAR